MISRSNIAIATGIGTIILCALVAACGGSGGGSTMNPPPPPVPSTSPVLSGTMNVATGGTVGSFTYGPAANATVVFSCGCSVQAGTATTDGGGAFTLVANSMPTPSAPDPTYTIVPGRNYIVVATTAAGAEGWTTQFAGAIASHNQYLNAGNTSDVLTAAVSLYVFRNSSSGVTAFDGWNFNTLVNWYNQLNTAPNTQETKLLNDIAAQSKLNKTLFPGAPSWHPGQATNGAIAADLDAVKTSGDAAIPTPCPGGENGCTNTPTP